MPRTNGRFRAKWYPILVKRDGERCAICGRRPPGVYLEIDHRDGDPRNNPIDGSNFQLLCRGDNRTKNPRGKGRRKSALNAESIDTARPSSAEFLKNQISEPLFCHWLDTKMRTVKPARMLLSETINSGAYVAQCTQPTIKKYLMKLCSNEGPYQVIFDEMAEEKFIEFRNGMALGISADNIESE